MRVRKVARTAVLACALALVAVACQSAETDDGQEVDENGQSEDENAAEVDFDPDATLRFGSNVPLSRFDPHRAASAADVALLAITYDRLIHRSPDGDPVPGLAEDWEFTDEGDALIVTVRQGVVFHDGEPLDAEAVRANIDRAMTVEGSTVASELDSIESVEVEDEYTVRINLDGAGGALPLILSDRAGMMVSPEAFDDDLDLQPVGAGMFTVTENRPGDRIRYERFDDYWDPDAVWVQAVDARILEDSSTRLNALVTGEIDVTTIDAPQVQEAEGQGVDVFPNPGVAFFHLQMAYDFEPFSDVRVRQALNHAIDREAIVEGVMFGAGNATSQPFPPDYFGYDPELDDPYPYDPDRARELLQEAGYDGGFEFEMTVNTIPYQESVALAVQANLAAVGVTATINQGDPAQIADWCYSEQICEGMMSMWTGRADPAQTLSLLYSEDGFANLSRGVTTAEFTDALEGAQAVGTPEEREDAVRQTSAQATTDALDVPIASAGIPIAANDNTVNVREWIVGKIELREVGIAP